LPTSSETEEIVAGRSAPSSKLAHSTEGSPSEGADFQKGTEDLSKLGSDHPSGSFSISDWEGYSALVPKPKGPFRLPEGVEYDAARGAADKANRIFRRKQGLVGKPVDVHEIHPVKFGGSPTDPANKIVLPRDVHQQQVTPWWNQLLKDLGEKK
jgi:filamentous hemagglutinin